MQDNQRRLSILALAAVTFWCAHATAAADTPAGAADAVELVRFTLGVEGMR